MYFIFGLIDIIWKWIDILPKVIIISINNPLINKDKLVLDISYIPLENSNIPNKNEFILLLKGRVSLNKVTNNDINNRLENIIDKVFIVVTNEEEYIFDSLFIFICLLLWCLFFKINIIIIFDI